VCGNRYWRNAAALTGAGVSLSAALCGGRTDSKLGYGLGLALELTIAVPDYNGFSGILAYNGILSARLDPLDTGMTLVPSSGRDDLRRCGWRCGGKNWMRCG
jgi:hypothetical protein